MKYLILILMASPAWSACLSFAPCIEADTTFEERFTPQIKVEVEEESQEKNPISKEEIFNISRSYIGTPYLYGGEGQNGIDCSAFIQQIFASVGVNLPRTSRQQFKDSRLMHVDSLAPLDLLFFKAAGENEIDHVALYLGDGQMIHSSSKEGGVQITDFKFSEFWSRRYAGARRFKNLKENL